MALFRTVKTTFWEDEKVIDEFSPEDRYFFLYLLTNPQTTQLGIYRLVPRTASFYLGYSKETVKVLLDRFENKYNMIRYSHSTNEIAIKNFLRHSIIKGGTPVFDCLKKEESNVENKELVYWVINSLKDANNLNNVVRDFIEYFLNKNENENDNVNDHENENENERHDDVTSTSRTTTRKKPQKHKYGEYNNVLLTDDEYLKLQELFPDLSERIERLSEYVASSGKAYKSHYATIRAWSRKEKPKQTVNSYKSQQFSADEQRIATWAERRHTNDRC